MPRVHRSALLLVVPLLLTGCGEDAPPRSTAATSVATPAPAPTAQPEPTAVPDAPSPSSQPPRGSTAVQTAEPSGGPLTVTAVRAARQDGFDRVVLELAGREAGVPGYRVEYVDDPRQQGSGDPVDVTGDAVLQVIVTGTGYPFDTGEEEAEDATLGGDLELVEDVELGAVFEGQYEAWIGLSQQRPFTVTVLSDPARVVVDVQHAG
jgi:hypothetical protein